VHPRTPSNGELMSAHDGFLRSIIEELDDDTPRLVYADWLDDHDDPARAELIRVQCSLARMADEDPRRHDLRRREQELLRQHGRPWVEGWAGLVHAWVYRRGCIEGVQMRRESSRAEILAVLRKAPIRHIRDLSQLCDLGGVVAVLPELRRLTGL